MCACVCVFYLDDGGRQFLEFLVCFVLLLIFIYLFIYFCAKASLYSEPSIHTQGDISHSISYALQT